MPLCGTGTQDPQMLLRKLLTVIFFLRTFSAKSTLSEKCCGFCKHTCRTCSLGIVNSAGWDAVACWILEHLTKECKEVALRRQAAKPGQSCAFSGAGKELPHCKQWFMEATNDSWKTPFQVAEWPLMHTGSLGPHSSRDKILMLVPN